MSEHDERTVQVMCPQCGTLNRVPGGRLGEHPVCGRCGTGLFAGQVIDLDAASFERHLSRSGLPFVVDFWAQWCGPCKMMAPAYLKAAAELEPQVRLAKLDTEAEQAIAARYAIRSIPTMIAFRDGREIARSSGAMGAADIVRWVRGALR